MRKVHPASFAVIFLLAVTGACADESLTVDRLFAAPDLNGPVPRGLKISPDGARVSFLKGKAEDRNQLDLWSYDVGSDTTRMLVDSQQLLPDAEQLSDQEKARRERLRIAALRGIVDYYYSKDGNALLFPLGGDLYYYELEGAGAARRLTKTEAQEADPNFSPHGRYVSFVRDQDLYVIELATGNETRLTTDGDGPVKNGLAEFIAQEEMGRYTGYWWAPDDSAIAYLRVDESTVEVHDRLEVYAEEFKVFPQRYPATGTNNVVIQLGVVSPSGGATRWLDLGEDKDIYVPRVNWLPDGRHLAVQRQSRDQQTLDLIRYDTHGGDADLLLSETSDTWIELHDDLTFLKKSQQFIWTSHRSGHNHLYLYDLSGNSVRPLTEGEWDVTELEAVYEDRGELYFSATAKSPTERHLYRVSLKEKNSTPVQLSQETGWHEIEMEHAAAFYIDRYQSPDTPPQVSVHDLEGQRLTYVEENRLDASHPYAPYKDAHVSPEFGTLEAADGQTLHYYLRKPADFDPARRYPAIVYVYGGPRGARVEKIWGSLFEQVLARHGYAVFSLDNRGTGYRGAAFDAPIYLRLGGVEVEDQLAGLKFLKRLDFVDAERVGLFGWSYGGYMTLMTTLKAPSAFAAAVSGAPVTDWALYDTHYTERYMGRPADNPEGYAAGNVLTYADALATPLLIMHGMADDNVLFTHSTKLFTALQQADRPFDIMTYPGDKHGLLRDKKSGRHAYKAIQSFFDRHLKNGAN